MKPKVFWEAQERWPGRRVRADKTLGDRLAPMGCWLMFAGLCALGYLGWTTDWRYGLALLIVLLALTILTRIGMRRNRRELLAALDAAFLPKGHPAPKLKERGAYGFPFFTLTFATQKDMEAAEAAGCVLAFTRFIQQRYDKLGSADNPFDANQAVCTVYEGWQPQLQA